jgi:hypothetical protein
MSTIVHVIPEGVFEYQFQGSYKDVSGRARFLQENSRDYFQVIVSEDSPRALENALAGRSPTHFLVEYSNYKHIVSYVRARWPKAYLGVRAHNIEPLQFLANSKEAGVAGTIERIYGMCGLFKADLTCMSKADAIYSISDWELKHYWNRLPGKAETRFLPYFSPSHLVGSNMVVPKEKIIACLAHDAGDFRHRDLVVRFIEFAQAVRTVAADYRFCVTGTIERDELSIPEFVELPGMVQDIPSFLKSVSAVAILSPIGYGHKTAITDALANGCYALVHPKWYRRCSSLIRGGCIEVKDCSLDRLEGVLNLLERPCTFKGINDALLSVATETLKRDYLAEQNS